MVSDFVKKIVVSVHENINSKHYQIIDIHNYGVRINKMLFAEAMEDAYQWGIF